MKTLNTILGTALWIAGSGAALAGETIELNVGTLVNVCSTKAGELSCETRGTPEDPRDFVKQIELQDVEGVPEFSIGVYTEKKAGFEYALVIMRAEFEGQRPFYSIAAASGKQAQTSEIGITMIEELKAGGPGSTALVVDDLRHLQFVMHSGASELSSDGKSAQPVLVFGQDDLSEQISLKQKSLKALK